MSYTQILSVSVSPKDENQILSIPFEITEELMHLHIAYEFKGSSVIDLGLAFEDKPKGWSGGARKEFDIYNHWATPGYKKGISKGMWQVLLGTYKITENTQVKITITQTPVSARWYKGDLHCHSHHSDGVFSFQQLAQMAVDKELDFLAVTDHNTSTQNQEYFALSPLILIPGMELTTTKGHANFLGAIEACTDFRGLKQSDFDGYFAEAKSKGAIIGINHPFSPHPWLKEMKGDYYEIWNGPWRERNNADNRKHWYEMLKKGLYMPISGGSDFHNPQKGELALPTTHIYGQNNDAKSLLKGLSQGKAYITASPNELTFNALSQGEVCLGEKVKKGQKILFTFKGLLADMQIHLVTNEGTQIIHEHTSLFEFEYKVENETNFVVIEVWQKDELLLISNPIWII